jgi:EmrB/QacA subfamily drug resistance transporter
LGGVLIEGLSWHWIFFVNLPVGLLGLWLSRKYLPFLKPAGGQKFDFAGAATLFVSLLTMLVALTISQSAGFSDTRVLGLFLVSILFLGIFIWIERRNPQPMIDLRLFRNRQFDINLLTGLLTFIAIAGTFILLPFYLENILGYDPRQTGVLLAVIPITLGIMSPISGILSDRFGPRLITLIGLVVLLIGYWLTSSLDAQTTALEYIIRFLPVGLGMGIFQSPNNSEIMGAAPRQQLGVVSGMLAVTRTLGQTVGIAVLGALWASRVYAQTGGPVPGGATAAPVEAQVAALQDTILAIVALIAVGLALSLWSLATKQSEAAKQSRTEAAQYFD